MKIFTEDQMRRAMLAAFRNGAYCSQSNLCEIKKGENGENLVVVEGHDVDSWIEQGFDGIINRLKSEN